MAEFTTLTMNVNWDDFSLSMEELAKAFDQINLTTLDMTRAFGIALSAPPIKTERTILPTPTRAIRCRNDD